MTFILLTHTHVHVLIALINEFCQLIKLLYTTMHGCLLMQVVWLGRPIADSTWEPESSLPPSLVADYEAGILREIQKETLTTGGQTVHTLSASVIEPSVKCPRTDLSDHTSSLSG